MRLPVDNLKPGVIVHKEDLVGMAVSAGLYTNSPVYQQQLVVPNLVTKGATVMLVYQQGNLAIKTNGVVLDSAPKGAIVRARNLRSNSIVNGKVIDQGTVLIPSLAKMEQPYE